MPATADDLYRRPELVKLRTALCLISSAALWTVFSAEAHHSFAAEFDADSPIKLSGIVTKVEWQNPHAFFYLDIETDDGRYENWAFALGSIASLGRQGWYRDTLQIGDEVHVVGHLAHDGSRKVNARTVTRSTGEPVLEGSNVQTGYGNGTRP